MKHAITFGGGTLGMPPPSPPTPPPSLPTRPLPPPPPPTRPLPPPPSPPPKPPPPSPRPDQAAGASFVVASKAPAPSAPKGYVILDSAYPLPGGHGIRAVNLLRHSLVPLSEATKFPEYIPKLYRKDPEYIARLAEAKAKFEAEEAKGPYIEHPDYPGQLSPFVARERSERVLLKYNLFRAELDTEIGRRYVEAYVAAKKDWESDRAGATKYQYKHKAPGSDEWVDVDTTPRVLRQAEPSLKPEATSRATKVVPQEKMPVQAKAPQRGVMYSDKGKQRLTRRPRRGFRRVRPERWGI